MKKRFSLIIAIALGLGSLTACGDTEKTAKTETKQASADTKSTAKTKKIPTERTVTLEPGAEYPWEGAFPEQVNKWIDQGETVYLYSDLEHFEKAFVNIIDLDIIKNRANPQVIKQRTDEIAKQLKPLKPDMKDYFDKLTDAGNTAANGDYDSAKTKIEEAKKLREAK